MYESLHDFYTIEFVFPLHVLVRTAENRLSVFIDDTYANLDSAIRDEILIFGENSDASANSLIYYLSTGHGFATYLTPGLETAIRGGLQVMYEIKEWAMIDDIIRTASFLKSLNNWFFNSLIVTGKGLWDKFDRWTANLPDWMD